MLKFFRVPFAQSGTKAAVPDAAAGDGSVSYIEGYGADYERTKTDPLSKNIERSKMNQLLFDATTAIGELQGQGVPDWITSVLNGGSAYSYAANALVRYSDGFVYLSRVAANVSLPTDATKWARVDQILQAFLALPASQTDGSGTLVGSLRAFIGNATPSGDNSGLLIGRTLTGSLAGGAHGVRDESSYTPSGGGLLAYASYDAAATILGGGALNHIRGHQARPNYGGTNTIAEVTGVFSQPSHTGTGVAASVFGSFTADASGSGTITAQYGHWVQPLTRGGVNYAFYSAGSTPSVLNGTLSVALGISGLTGTFSDQLVAKGVHASGVPTSYLAGGGLLMSYNGTGNGQVQAYANGSGAGVSTLSLVCGSAVVVNLSATGVLPGSDNAYSLGASGFRYSVVWAATGTISTSDARAKTSVENSALGLNFILSLRPVSYLYIEGGKTAREVEDGTHLVLVSPAVEAVIDQDTGAVLAPAVPAVYRTETKYRTEYDVKPGSRRHWGLIAQEVKTAVDAAGVDFAGWVLDDVNDPNSGQGLRYEQFVAPLIKAVQELTARVEALENK